MYFLVSFTKDKTDRFSLRMALNHILKNNKTNINSI